MLLATVWWDQVISRIERHDRYSYFCEEGAWAPRDGYQGPLLFDDIRQRNTVQPHTSE